MIKATKVEIVPGRMRIWLRMADGAPRHTTPELARKAASAYPTLPMHSCINSHGPTFGDVMEGTSIPHLLEHLVIAEQAALAKNNGLADTTFVGTTEWTSPERVEAVTEVSFVDDLHAVAALRSALDFLNSQTV